VKRFINLALLFTFLFCYLEWADRSSFIFQAEYEFFFGGKDVVGSFSHPLILLPFLGQILLLITVFLRRPNRALSLTGLLLLCPLVFMIFLVGVLSLNWRILVSTIPFLLSTIIFFKYFARRHVKPETTL
jgi:hypothetical protein